MVESQLAAVLDEHDGARSSRDCDMETFTLELDILGKPACFHINVENVQARLSDMVPLARAFSTKMAIATLERLRESGKSVPCCKGCSACCSYLVPLSVPETFRLVEELATMPPEKGRTLLRSSLDTAKTILEQMPRDLTEDESASKDNGIRSDQLGAWYAGLGLRCPFLSDNLCVTYDQRPIACREHIVTGSETSCNVEGTDEPDIVKMPVSVLECLGRLAAELEQSDVEAIMLPLALPWAQQNTERSKRTWPAVTMVEQFIHLMQETDKVRN
jgi:Fe-S-cluster containining protein